MKDVTLKIVGTHIYDNVEENQLELITEGKLYEHGEDIYLTYDESEFSGMEGCKTRLTLTGDVVSMTRQGSAVGIDTEIRFEKGKRYNGAGQFFSLFLCRSGADDPLAGIPEISLFEYFGRINVQHMSRLFGKRDKPYRVRHAA